MPVTIDADFVKAHLPKFSSLSHKGNFGRLGVLAGSYGMAGAAALVINAAYCSGAGLVYGFVPDEIYTILAVLCPNAVFYPISAGKRWTNDQLSRPNAWVAGCGMGNTEQTAKAIYRLLNLGAPLVLDADGLNALAGNIECLRGQAAVITPHEAEAARILRCTAADVAENRLDAVGRLADASGAVAVLKGHHTLISDGNNVYICEQGNNGMATAGSGDALAGVIGTFLAQGCPPATAAAMGVYLHAAAGDLAAKRLSKRGMRAMDIVSALAEIFRQFEA